MPVKPRIGLFDSGIGGLSVLSACLRQNAAAEYFYYGDNERAPYGSRPPHEIMAFTREAFETFDALGVDAAVIACNTATAVCVEEMRRAFSFPVAGVEPAVASAAKHGSNLLVIATPVTAQSARLRALIERFPDVAVTVYPAHGLAAAVEAHFLRGEALDLSRHLPAARGWDGVVLGCTHYALIRSEIAHFLGAPVYDGAEGTARHVFDLIKAGTGNHFQPREKPNNCLSSNCNQKTGQSVFFLGSGRKSNRKLFDLNICFNFI